MRTILLSILFLVSLFVNQVAAETLALDVDTVEVGVDPVTQQPIVTITLKPQSKTAVAAFSTLRVGESVTMRVDDMPLTKPVIREPILQGTLTIGGLTNEDARKLARDIGSGGRKLLVDGSDK